MVDEPDKKETGHLLKLKSEHRQAAAKKYKCVACLKHKKPNQVAPLSMPQPKAFNEVLQADVFCLMSSPPIASLQC